MRALAITALTLAAAACSVPDKSPEGPDAAPMPPDAMIDSEAPDTTITSAPAEFTQESVAVFEFTATEADVMFSCAFDGEDPVTCTSPYSRTLGDGTHTFVVRATDAVGNTASDMRTFVVDTTAPTVTIVTKPTNPTNSATV